MNYPSTLEEAKEYKYKFWSKQPVVGLNEIVSKDGPISETLTIGNPTKLPPDYEWLKIDLSNDQQMDQLITFLNEYYTNNKHFSQVITVDFMRWYYNDLSILLCAKSSKHNLFVGFISGKIVKNQLNRHITDFIEVKFLCVHAQLRHKKLVPCIITELKRQFNLLGFNKGFFNTNMYITKPVISAKCNLRPINIDKLLETEFLKIDTKNNSITIDNIKKVNELLCKNIPKNFRKMEECHIPRVYELFNIYSEKYNYHPVFTLEEFKQLFYNNKFVETYVFEYVSENGDSEDEDDECNDKYPIDFVSYYITEIKVTKGDHKGKIINKGTLFYYTSLHNTVYSIIKNILMVAKLNDIDVFCALDIMEHESILKDLNFRNSIKNYIIICTIGGLGY